jgi:hypothetical protein
MAASATLLQFLLMLVAGWLQRQQAATIDYLQAENRMLRERLGGRRIIFTDAERRTLAEKARLLGRKALREPRSSRPIRCFVGTANWSRANGPSLSNAGLVSLAPAKNCWAWRYA